MKCKQLSREKRNQIQYYLSMKLSHRKIASLLEVSNSTISREIKRNSTTQRRSSDEKYITKYDAVAAQNKYISRRARNRLKATDEFLNIIKKELSDFNSITTIVGKWRCNSYLELHINLNKHTILEDQLQKNAKKIQNQFIKGHL